MTPRGAQRVVFFEPWSLGDAIIAASALRELATYAALACHSSWHPILKAATSHPRALELIPIDLPYTTRSRANPFDISSDGRAATDQAPAADLVLSIRGDFRDYTAARGLFPSARIRMTGWIRFLGRKSALVNAPYALGFLRAQNRYRSWAKLSCVPYGQIEQTYRRLQLEAPRNRRVVIHLGAQWRSKQYPYVVDLRDHLKREQHDLILVAGPKDVLPAGLEETDVIRAADQELVDLLRSAEHVITNDSGPMHLAAFLGCRTTAVVRTSPIEEWLPPSTRVVRSSKTPRGYRPHRRYMTDGLLSDWPAVEEIVAEVRASDQNVAK